MRKSLDNYLGWEGLWEIEHLHRKKSIFKQIVKNDISLEGEQSLLDTYFRGVNIPTTFFLRLCYDTLVYTDTLATIQNEPTSYGYAAAELAVGTTDWPTIEVDQGNNRVVSALKTFTVVGGPLGPLNTVYLATTSNNTGLLISYASLSQERILYDGDQLKVRLRIKLKNAV